ncbi:hypothetical protein BKA81DRAFT_372601 [Phyllosticta paracitricarpa]
MSMDGKPKKPSRKTTVFSMQTHHHRQQWEKPKPTGTTGQDRARELASDVVGAVARSTGKPPAARARAPNYNARQQPRRLRRGPADEKDWILGEMDGLSGGRTNNTYKLIRTLTLSTHTRKTPPPIFPPPSTLPPLLHLPRPRSPRPPSTAARPS